MQDLKEDLQKGLEIIMIIDLDGLNKMKGEKDNGFN
jgi:hypothetical protein